MEPKILWSIPDSAQQISVGRSMMYELIARGDIGTVKIGRRRLVPHAELERYVAKIRGAAAA